MRRLSLKHLHQLTVRRECQSSIECLQCVVVKQSHLFIVQRRRFVHRISGFVQSTDRFQCVRIEYAQISVGGQCHQQLVLWIESNALHEAFVIAQKRLVLASLNIPHDGCIVH